MPGSPSVSLLMPNRDNGGVLEIALERLAQHTSYPDYELIVVDDGSTDGSRDVLRRWRASGRFPAMTVLEREHSGVAASLNAAVEASGGELLVSLDADAAIETPGWLDKLVALQQSDPRIGVVTAAIVLDTGFVHAYGVNLIGPEGMHDGGTTIREPIGSRTLNGAVHRPHVKELPPPRGPVEVDASIGCCMIYPRALFAEAGGYDTGFTPVWFEDLDLSLTARRFGTKVLLHGGIEVTHHVTMRGPGAGRFMRLAQRLPQRVKDVAAARLHPPTRVGFARLRSHYEYWRSKWGFDPLNPDMDVVFARYGTTEICWRYDEEMRAAGERIAAGSAASVQVVG